VMMLMCLSQGALLCTDFNSFVAGSTFIAWIVIHGCLSKRKKWSGILSGTKSEMSPCNMASWGIHQWTTAPTDTMVAAIIASRHTITALRYIYKYSHFPAYERVVFRRTLHMSNFI
jgi:hypothetical protein